VASGRKVDLRFDRGVRQAVIEELPGATSDFPTSGHCVPLTTVRHTLETVAPARRVDSKRSGFRVLCRCLASRRLPGRSPGSEEMIGRKEEEKQEEENEKKRESKKGEKERKEKEKRNGYSFRFGPLACFLADYPGDGFRANAPGHQIGSYSSGRVPGPRPRTSPQASPHAGSQNSSVRHLADETSFQKTPLSVSTTPGPSSRKGLGQRSRL